MTICKEALFAKIKESLVKTLDLDAETITLESNVVEDLNADSISLMEFTLALEDEFGIEIPDEEAENFKSISDICTFIEENK